MQGMEGDHCIVRNLAIVMQGTRQLGANDLPSLRQFIMGNKDESVVELKPGNRLDNFPTEIMHYLDSVSEVLQDRSNGVTCFGAALMCLVVPFLFCLFGPFPLSAIQCSSSKLPALLGLIILKSARFGGACIYDLLSRVLSPTLIFKVNSKW